MKSITILTALLAILLADDVQARDITLTSSDGTQLHAVYNEPAANKNCLGAVVLIHAEKRQAADWKYLSNRLNQLGFKTIAPDLRGHGQNIPEDAPAPTIQDSDYQAMVDDVRAALDYMASGEPEKLVAMGASLGANLVMHAAAADERVSNVILLSPGLNYHGVTSADALRQYGEREILIVVSDEDHYSAKTGLLLISEAAGESRLEVYHEAGHGTTMLNREPALEGLIVSWLLGTHHMDADSMFLPNPTMDLGNEEDIETTGPRLPAH